MTTELEQALALLFRRARETPAGENELAKIMSLALSWTKPSKATNLLARGVNAGLLDHDGEGYSPTFDPGDVDVPFGFQPPEDLFEDLGQGQAPARTTPAPTEPDRATSEQPPAAQPESQPPAEPEPAPPAPSTSTLLETMLDAIAEHQGEGRQRAVASVNAKQEALGSILTLDTAALLVARELGIDVTDWARQVREQLEAKAASA